MAKRREFAEDAKKLFKELAGFLRKRRKRLSLRQMLPNVIVCVVLSLRIIVAIQESWPAI